jgi:hypothetical protein
MYARFTKCRTVDLQVQVGQVAVFFGFSAMTMSYNANIIFVILHFTMFEPYNWANSSKRSKTA